MLFTALKCLFTQLVVGSMVLLMLALGLAAFYDLEYVLDFVEIATRDMFGLAIWTLGCGLVVFMRREASTLTQALAAMLVSSNVTAAAISTIDRSRYQREALPFTLPITTLGILLALGYGAPHHGASHWILTLLIVWVHYIAAMLLAHFVAILTAFHELYRRMDEVRFRDHFSPLHTENLISYMSITTTIGILAVYAGFRGTLTAGFQFRHEALQAFLTTPLILFLPATLFYNFYPRHVLRKIVQHRIFEMMRRLGEAKPEDAKETLLEIRGAIELNNEILPFFDYKSLPSYLVAVVFALSVIYNHDPQVKEFFRVLIGTSGQSAGT